MTDLRVSLSPDNRMLIITSRSDENINLWDAVSGVHLRTFKTGSECPEVSFSPDGSRCTSWGYDTPLRLWDTATWTTIKILDRHGHHSPLATFPSNRICMGSGSKDGTVRLWNAMSGTQVMTLGSGCCVRSLAFSPGGGIIASGSTDGTIQLWDVASGACINTLKLGGLTYSPVSFSPDGLHIVVCNHRGSSGYQLELWHISRGKKLKSIPWNSEYPALWIPFSLEHSDLATGNETRIWAKPSSKLTVSGIF